MAENLYLRYFRRARTTSNTTASQACMEILGPTVAKRISYIKELDVTLNTAVASILLAGRPTAAGITPVASALYALDGGDDSLATYALSWGTSPTIPNKNFNRLTFPATIGTRLIVTFPGNGLALRQNETFVLFNSGTVGTFDVSVTILE